MSRKKASGLQNSLKRRNRKHPEDSKLASALDPNKIMNLNKLRELIDELYRTKKKQDQTSLAAQTPIKTMEEHLVSILQKRYGLKRIVEANLSSTILSVKHFEKEDVHVYIFDKILRFSVEEEFVKVLHTVSQTIQLVYLHILKSQNPGITEENLQILYKQSLLGFIPLTTALKIIRFLYPNEDFKTLSDALKSFAEPKR